LLPINILLSSVILRAELTEDFGKVFDLEKVFSLFKRTWKDFLLVYLVMIPLGLLFVMGGMLLFFIGIYPVAVWLNVTYLHLRWQVYEKYLSAGGEAIPIQTKSGPLPSETPRPLAPPPPAPART
ncbi:MAG TPA: hypothetical protein DF383_13605, partial [Deltaproteobacteria bacterium]|nr:hypothetical protein [Deltaproteobacteria bacterium]